MKINVNRKKSQLQQIFNIKQFDWKQVSPQHRKRWTDYSFDEKKWWGDFPKDEKASRNIFRKYPWAIGSFKKYSHNPILAPTMGAWDQGCISGGVRNGSILRKGGKFYYLYRGERPIDVPTKSSIDYICDIGVAVSKDGIHFVKDDTHSPFFRKGKDRRFSYEDVCCVKYKGIYYLFCNQWLWGDQENIPINGVFLATSKDLLHWEKIGIVFPQAKRTHRNGCILQNPQNEAVRVNGKFIMYINHGLMAYSDDLIHWESKEIKYRWPGGEGCFAITDHNPKRPDDIILFTGGNHTGHFYAIGEVLFSKSNPENPIEYLPRPVLCAETKYPYENGFSAETPHRFISTYADCIFFNGLTRYKGKWWMYYGGSEYYTCLATMEKY